MLTPSDDLYRTRTLLFNRVELPTDFTKNLILLLKNRKNLFEIWTEFFSTESTTYDFLFKLHILHIR